MLIAMTSRSSAADKPIIVPVPAKNAARLAKQQAKMTKQLEEFKAEIKRAFADAGVDGELYDLNVNGGYFVLRSAEAQSGSGQLSAPPEKK
jgi:hypothetical protein